MKLTHWIDGCLKPLRAGLYQRRARKSGEVFYSYWTGTRWGLLDLSPDEAARFAKLGRGSSLQPGNLGCLEWRGLLK